MPRYDVAPLDGFPPETGLMLAALEDSQREWAENLGTPEREAIGWQMHEHGPSIGMLLLHMADCELYWFEQFIGGRPADRELERELLSLDVKQDDGLWPLAPDQPWDWYLALHGRVVRRARAHLRDEDPGRVVSRGEDSFTVRWVVAHVLEHDAYHGGQAVMLHEAWKRR
ncbi:MAG: DinB family protein [Fimbriimonadaceae bacterium]